MEGIRLVKGVDKREQLDPKSLTTSLKDGELPAPKDEQIQSILSDPEKQRLFGQLITRTWDPVEAKELWQKYAERTLNLTSDQDVKLEKTRQEFIHAMRIAEKATEVFSQTRLEDIAHVHIYFGALFHKIQPPARATELIHMQLRALAVKDPERLITLINKQSEIEGKKKRPAYKDINATLEKYQKSYSLSDQNLKDILAIEKKEDRQKKLQGYIHKSYTDPVLGLFDEEGYISKYVARFKLAKLDRMKAEPVLKEMGDIIVQIGTTLEAFTNEDKDFVSALRREAAGGAKLEIKDVESAISLADVQRQKDLMTEQKLRDRWNREKDKIAKEMKSGQGWNERDANKQPVLNDVDRDEIRDEFLRIVADELAGEKGVGFYSNVRNLFYETEGKRILEDIGRNKRDKLK